MTRNKIHGFVGAVALAFALNGCGGSSEQEEMPPPAGPTAEEQAETILGTSKAEVQTAKAGVDNTASAADQLMQQMAVETAAQAVLDLIEDATHGFYTTAQLLAAQMAVTNAQAAVMMAQTAKNEADAAATAAGEAAAAAMKAETDLSNANDALQAAKDAVDGTASAADQLMQQMAVQTAAQAALDLIESATHDLYTTAQLLAAQMAVADAESAVMMAQTAKDAADVAAADAAAAAAAAAKAVADLSAVHGALQDAKDAVDDTASEADQLMQQMAVETAAQAVVDLIGAAGDGVYTEAQLQAAQMALVDAQTAVMMAQAAKDVVDNAAAAAAAAEAAMIEAAADLLAASDAVQAAKAGVDNTASEADQLMQRMAVETAAQAEVDLIRTATHNFYTTSQLLAAQLGLADAKAAVTVAQAANDAAVAAAAAAAAAEAAAMQAAAAYSAATDALQAEKDAVDDTASEAVQLMQQVLVQAAAQNVVDLIEAADDGVYTAAQLLAAQMAVADAETAVTLAEAAKETADAIIAQMAMVQSARDNLLAAQATVDEDASLAVQKTQQEAVQAAAAALTVLEPDDADAAAATASADMAIAVISATEALRAAVAAVAAVDEDEDASRAMQEAVKEAAAVLAALEPANPEAEAATDNSTTAITAIETEQTTEAAGTKEKAIAAEAGQDPDADVGGSVAQDETTTYSLAITRPRAGTMIEIDDTANAKDGDPEFMQETNFGGGRTKHVRTMEDDDGNMVEEVVIVSTDIEAPKATAFAKVAGQELNVDEDDVMTADNAEDAVALDPGGALVETNPDQAAVLSKMMSSEFAAALGTSVTHTFAAEVADIANTDADESVDAAKFAGFYNTAPGMYRCSGADECTVTVDSEGMLTAASDGWIFTPAKRATSDVPDPDHMHYGFWLKKTTDEDRMTTYNEVETFAVSSVVPSGTVSDVVGDASYDGGAVGVYVKNVYDSDGEVDTATSGHFNADASLTAYFGGGDVAENKQNTVTGIIDNFKLSGGESNEWSVNLKSDAASTDGTASGEANGGGAEGSFSATFHGSVELVDHDMDDSTPVVRPTPSSVVGEFDANFSNGSVAGGFGARRE